MRTTGLTIPTSNWDRVSNLRVQEVVMAGRLRSERLFKPQQKFTPSEDIVWDWTEVPKEKNSFKTIEEMLEAVRQRCR